MFIDKNIEELKNLKFRLFQESPILYPPRFSTLIADPTVLTPDLSPDKHWHLFAHSLFGIHHYKSLDGINFSYYTKLHSAGLRPYIFFEEGQYYLFFEKYSKRHILTSWLPGRKWFSEIAYIYSKDLVNWSKEGVLFSPSMPHHHAPNLGSSVSNPCVIKDGAKYLFYYSSSLVYIPDCGFNEPQFICRATSDKLLSGYIHDNAPIIYPDVYSTKSNLGAGAIKVIKVRDGYIGFQNGIYAADGISGSALWLLYSHDGINWSCCLEEPILKPSNGWMASHIYACSPNYYENRWYLFFNARNHAHWSKGTEKIGLAVSEI